MYRALSRFLCSLNGLPGAANTTPSSHADPWSMAASTGTSSSPRSHDGVMRVQLDSGVQVLSAVLTLTDFHEHREHRRFFAGHFVKNGIEVSQACLLTLAGMAELDNAR
jgi:hypothetical protein